MPFLPSLEQKVPPPLQEKSKSLPPLPAHFLPPLLPTIAVPKYVRSVHYTVVLKVEVEQSVILF